MRNGSNGRAPRDIALVVSDVDGTLVDRQKRLTERAVASVQGLRAAGIAFAITSSRPPRGLRHIGEPLGITTPIGGFNGGVIVTPAFEPLAANPLAPETAREAIAYLEANGVHVWVFDGVEWFVTDRDGPHVDHESRTVQFEPQVVERFDDHLGRVGKLVGVSDDHPRLAACEAALRERLAPATVVRSQDYYLDITHPVANKGTVVRTLSERLGIEPARILVIGDGLNDVPMFAEAGFAVAMGQAGPELMAVADAVTAANDAEGFAEAIDRHVLGLVS